MKKIVNLLKSSQTAQRHTNNSTEFQEYGVYLADSLSDPKHYALYIKYAKELPRAILEEALSYVKDYPNAKSKAKLFMWKLKQLKTKYPSFGGQMSKVKF